jgi:hypothetical protein
MQAQMHSAAQIKCDSSLYCTIAACLCVCSANREVTRHSILLSSHSMLHASAWLTVLLHFTEAVCGVRLVTDKEKVETIHDDHVVVDATAVAVALKPGEVIGLYRLNEKVAALGLKSRHEATCYAFRAPEFLSSTAATTVPDSSSSKALSSELLSVDSSSAQAAGLSLQLHEAYRLGGKFNGGSHGEIWRGKRVNGDQVYAVSLLYVALHL